MASSLTVTLATVVFLVGTAYGQEKKIRRSDLPRAVRETISKEGHGLPEREFSEETKNGQTIYEASFWIGFQNKTLFIDSDGRLTAVKEWISTAVLPAPVLQGLLAQAGGAKILKVRTLEQNGTLVAYEAKITTDGKRSHVRVDLNGIPLASE